MTAERVKKYLKKFGMENNILEFDQSSATVELAAQAVGVEPDRICKTLSFILSDNRCALIQLAGQARVDNKKFRKEFGCKAKMLKPDQVKEFTGYEIGGVCAFDIDTDRVDVWCDISLKKYDSVFPACGTSNSAIQIAPEKLYDITESKGWIDVSK